MIKENLAFDSLLLLNTKGIDFDNNEIEFPFKVALSFKKLIHHIEERCKSNDKIIKSLAHSVLNELKLTPELLEPIYDLSEIKKHERLISNMMIFVFPDAFLEKQTFATTLPFFFDVFYSSPKFREIIKIKDGVITGQMNLDKLSFNFGRIIGAYATVLNRAHGINLQMDFPIVYKIPDPVTGLDRYFKLNIADEFAEVIIKGKRKEFSQDEITSIRANLYDLEYMKKMIPGDKYELHGFVAINVINITDTEILSSMKRDLIEKDTITTISGFLKLQHSMKSLLRCPDIFLGLADFPGSTQKLFQFGTKIGNSFIMNDKCVNNLSCDCIDDSIYKNCFEFRKVVIIEDLEKYPNRTVIEDEILKQGIRNILIAPLIYGNEIVGILELGSPIPGEINMVNTLKLREVLPLFAMAVARSKEEMNNKIQSVIKEKCTAIHPTLEWRFRDAAMKMLREENNGIQTEMEEIVFHNVYPLYGLSDIRNSSLQRNNAIKDDLIENLNLALEVISASKKHKNLHAFDELTYRIDKKIDALKFSIDSGDEAMTLSFLRKEIEPLFKHLYEFNTDVKNSVIKYRHALDEKLGLVIKNERDLEEA